MAVLSDSFGGIDVVASALGILRPYNEPGLLDPEIFAVTAQDNITWSNSVDYFTYDLDILSIEISATGDFQTIYFSSNLGYPKLIFRVGDFAKLSYAEQNFEAVVEVLASTLNSITFQTIVGFPNNYQGGMTIQLATVFSYPKQRVFDQFITESYPFKNISRPRENLFVSEYRPVQQDRTVSFFIDREFSDALPQLNSTTNKLNTFDTDSRLPADWIIKIIGENTEIKYNTQLWYREDLDVITYSTEPITEKILYFEDQETLLFKAGDTVRLYNPALNYSKFVEVLTATSRSITIEVPENYPGIGNLFIENLTTSVYPQKFVSLYPGEQPKTPRDNLFYFEFLPTLRASKLSAVFDTVGFELVTDFFKDNIRVTDVGLKIQFNAIEKDSVRVRAVTDNLTVSKLSAAVKVSADTVDRSLQRVEQFTSQLTVRPITTPTNAAERFYYFNLTPGYRANRTIVQGSQLFQENNRQAIETLSKDIVRVNSVETNFKPENLKYVNVVFSDRTELKADLLDKFKTDNYITADMVLPDFLEKSYVKVVSLDNLLFADRLSAAVKVIDAKIILSANTLKSSITVRESQPFRDVNYVDKFLTKDYTDVGTVQTNFLTKEIFNLQETIKVDDYGNLSAASVLKESIPVDSIGNVRAMTILRPTNTFDVYEEIDEYNNQFDTVISNVFPTTARENYFYFNQAPGYRSNSSLQQGFVFDTVVELQPFEFLSRFEFQGLTGGPTYAVTGQDQGLTANTVLYYINDLDILTVTDRPVDAITLFFDNPDKKLNPYAVGTFVVITRLDVDTGIEFTYNVEVIDSGFNFIKTLLLEDWNNRWKFTNITTPYADFYPTERVSSTTAPQTPREVLRYSQIAPGYSTNNTLQQGYAFEPDYAFDLSKIISIERDSTKLFEVFSDTLLNRTFNLEKSLMLLNEVYTDSVKFDGRIEISKFGEDFNEFAVVLIPDNQGLVIRLRTDRYQDIAVPKREPIQFWN